MYEHFSTDGVLISSSDDIKIITKSFMENNAKGWIENEAGTVVEGYKPIGTVNISLTWRGILPMLLTAYEGGTPTGRAMAWKELQRMADIADGEGRA